VLICSHHAVRLKLRALHRFSSTATAVEDITAIQDGKLPKGLKKFLSDEVVGKGKGKETLAVTEPKLGAPCSLLEALFSHNVTYLVAGAISKKLGINVVADSNSLDLYRGIRGQLVALMDGLDPADLATMSLGLSHSLSRCY
jgi:nucleolar protein 58